jgi:hypothetical protein
MVNRGLAHLQCSEQQKVTRADAFSDASHTSSLHAEAWSAQMVDLLLAWQQIPPWH